MIALRETGERGWAFPIIFCPDAEHRDMAAPGTNAEDANLRQSLALILQIDPGERPLLPTFGCNLSRFVFERFDLSLGIAIGATVRRAIEQWEPRIKVGEVNVTANPEGERTLTLAITYTVLATQRTATIELPYTWGEATGAVQTCPPS